jgi:serine/threonine-protein kinase
MILLRRRARTTETIQWATASGAAIAITTGRRIGPYEVLSTLGSGGMGDVYRARDGKLNRDVALKVLPDAFALDAERLARFRREAQVLAALNHPHIAAIYGFEDSGSVHALVMEIVEGETLRGPLPVARALSLAKQIAEALEYAHERGVVHRDLKPANIKVTPDGVIKLLDFGLAKAVENPAAAGSVNDSPTLTFDGTRAGLILGTAAFMAPEQAQGKAADRRADIWSFGAVFYEMLSGKQAFAGESVSDTLASVLKDEPDWSALPSDTPEAIRLLLRRCLAKDRKQRLQAIGEARIALDDVASGRTGGTTTAVPVRSSRWWFAVAGWLAAAAAAVVGVALWRSTRQPPAPAAQIVRFTIGQSVANLPGSVALSRDGSQLAYVGDPDGQIYVRELDRLDARPVPGTEGASIPCFSPDGKSVSFLLGEGSHVTLNEVSIQGGPVQPLAPAPTLGGPPAQSWAATGDIFYTSDGVLMKFPANGGKPETVLSPRAGSGVRWYAAPQLLPDGHWLLVSASMGLGPSALRAIALNLSTGEQKTLLDHVGLTQYLPAGASGYLAYYDALTASLKAVAFDPIRLESRGLPAPVLDGIQNTIGPFGLYAVSDSGVLVYGRGTPGSTLVWVDRHGAEQALGPARRYNFVRLSPDGQRVALTISGESDDLWIYTIRTGTLTRITSEGNAVYPVWTPDSATVIYARRPDDVLLAVPADGSAAPRILASHAFAPTAVSSSGTLIGFLANRMQVLSLRTPTSGEMRPSPFPDSGVNGGFAVFSPNGNWVAYETDDSAKLEVYVTPYPGPGPKVPISVDGGDYPRWAASGRELFFRNGNKMMSAAVDTGAQFRSDTPTVLFTGNYASDYDPAPDGTRFLMIGRAGQPSGGDRIEVVVNWFEELKRLIPPK